MEFGIQSTDLLMIRNILREYPEIEKVLIYGSRAKGNYQPASDIDLTLVGSALDLTLQQDLEIKLDDLLLPYKFDISIFHQISNPDVVNHINRVGKVFYQK